MHMVNMNINVMNITTHITNNNTTRTIILTLVISKPLITHIICNITTDKSYYKLQTYNT